MEGGKDMHSSCVATEKHRASKQHRKPRHVCNATCAHTCLAWVLKSMQCVVCTAQQSICKQARGCGVGMCPLCAQKQSECAILRCDTCMDAALCSALQARQGHVVQWRASRCLVVCQSHGARMLPCPAARRCLVYKHVICLASAASVHVYWLPRWPHGPPLAAQTG